MSHRLRLRHVCSRKFLSGVFAVLALMMLSVAAAHSQNTYASRVMLAGAFNSALVLLMPDDSVLLGNAETGAITIRDPRTGELIINGSSDPAAIKLEYVDATHFKLVVRLRSGGGLMEIQPNSHEMVCDLEEAWLRRSWGLAIPNRVRTYVFGSGTTCADPQGQIAQPYFMSAITGLVADPLLNVALRDSGMMEWALDMKDYIVPAGTNGAEVSTANLLEFVNTTPGTDRFLHIAKKVDYTAPAHDSAIAKLAFTHVKFNVLSAIEPTTGPIITEIKLEAHTHASANDCSASLPDGPDANAAYVRLSYRADRRDGSGVQWYYCEQRWQTGNPDADNAALWSFFDKGGTSWQNIDGWGAFNIDTEGYLYFEARCESPARKYRIMQIRSRSIPHQNCELVLPVGGVFSVDDMTGELVYRECPSCTPIPVLCLPFVKQLSGHTTVGNVIAASAQTFSNEWADSPEEFLRDKVLNTWEGENTSNNDYETGRRIFRPLEAFAYRTGAKSSAGPTDRVYDNAGAFLNDQGVITNSLRLFNWKNPDANVDTKWLGAGAATMYSPLGEPVEERDILGIYSAAKFAHQFTVPKLVAKNARYDAVAFESFEDGEGDVNTTAHSGRWSLHLPANSPSKAVAKLVVDEQMRSQGVLVRLWARRTYQDYDTIDMPVVAESGFGTGSFVKVAQTGAWTLYERVCNVSAISAGTTIELKLKDTLSSDDVWIDDVRAQPFDAEMTCFVYDPAMLRVITQFDDQHFGMYYQYNGEGKLVRKLRETERGMKTVSEAQYHTPDPVDRDGNAASMTGFEGSGGPAAAAMMRDGAGGEGDGSGDTLASGRVNLLDIDAGPDGVKVKAFEGNGRLVDDIKALLTLDTARLNELQRSKLDALGLADAERLRLAMRAAELEQQMDEAAQRAEGAGDAAAKEESRKLIEALRVERDRILREHLGMSEEEFRNLCREVKTIGETAEGEEGKQ